MGIYGAQLISLQSAYGNDNFYSIIDFVPTNMHTSVVSQKIHRPSKTCKGADSLTLCSKVLCYSYKDQTFCLLLEFSKEKKLVFMIVPIQGGKTSLTYSAF